jgi:hypothetical protein
LTWYTKHIIREVNEPKTRVLFCLIGLLDGFVISRVRTTLPTIL